MGEANGRDDIKGDGSGRQDVCRDFLKNICNRGNRCKFFHPSDAPAQSDKETEIHFCIDFQNRGCHRDNCRFVHVPRDEAERYKATREVNLVLARAIAAVTTGDTINGIPVCKEFQTGKCSRGSARCRYWHVNIEEERERRRRGLPPLNNGPAMGGGGGGPAGMRGGGGGGGGGGGRGGPPPFDLGFGMRRPLAPDMDMQFEVKRARMGDRDMEMRCQDLEKRNAELMKEVEGLKREVQREHERYEDLYALFRQQTAAQANVAAANAAAAAAGQSSNRVGAYQQQQLPQSAPAPYGSLPNAAWGAQWTS